MIQFEGFQTTLGTPPIFAREWCAQNNVLAENAHLFHFYLVFLLVVIYSCSPFKELRTMNKEHPRSPASQLTTSSESKLL